MGETENIAERTHLAMYLIILILSIPVGGLNFKLILALFKPLFLLFINCSKFSFFSLLYLFIFALFSITWNEVLIGFVGHMPCVVNNKKPIY